MSKKFLIQLEDRLRDRRHLLLNEVKLRLREFQDSGGYRLTDSVDIASNLIEGEIAMSIAQGEAREIEQIDNALKKIRKGNYGVCESCGTKINKHRLEAIPFVTLCIKCKEAEERDEGFETARAGSYRMESDDYGDNEAKEENNDGMMSGETSDINPYDN